jgi:hypothetical protein
VSPIRIGYLKTADAEVMDVQEDNWIFPLRRSGHVIMESLLHTKLVGA